MGGGKRRVFFMQSIFANDPDHIIGYGKSKTWVLLQEAALFAHWPVHKHSALILVPSSGPNFMSLNCHLNTSQAI